MRPVRRADNLTTFMCRLSLNLGASSSWNPQGLSRTVMGLLYLCLLFYDHKEVYRKIECNMKLTSTDRSRAFVSKPQCRHLTQQYFTTQRDAATLSCKLRNTGDRLLQITNLMHNSFILQQYVCYITILNMFRTVPCSSSGGQIVLFSLWYRHSSQTAVQYAG